MNSLDKIISDSYRGGRLILSMNFYSLENIYFTEEVAIEIASRPWP
jgi:hypothetical protein